MAEKQRLTHRVHTRINGEKYNELLALLAKSRGIKSLSELLRIILDKEKITVLTYDNSLDKVMEELTAIRSELHAIGVNINQLTRKFHSEKLPESKLLQVMEIEKQYRLTGRKVEELLTVIKKLSLKWLPE